MTPQAPEPKNLAKSQPTKERDEKPETVALAEGPLPTNFKGLMDLHRKLYDAIPHVKNKSVRERMTARHTEVKRRLNQMQQIPRGPVITADDHASIAKARSNHPQTRASALEKLRAALAASNDAETYRGVNTYVLKMPLTPIRPVNAAIRALLQCPGVALAIAGLRSALLRYKIAYLENFNQANPADRMAELKDHEIPSCADAGKLADLHAEATALSSPTAAIAAHSARVALQKAWEPVKDAERVLLWACESELENCGEEQLTYERSLPKDSPLKVFDTILQEVKARLAESTGPDVKLPQLRGAAPRTGDQTVLTSLLGLGVLADD